MTRRVVAPTLLLSFNLSHAIQENIDNPTPKPNDIPLGCGTPIVLIRECVLK